MSPVDTIFTKKNGAGGFPLHWNVGPRYGCIECLKDFASPSTGRGDFRPLELQCNFLLIWRLGQEFKVTLIRWLPFVGVK